MDNYKYWTADRARKKQTALTRLANGLRNEVVSDSRTRGLFTDEEVEAMQIASNALSNAKRKFEHLKEQKARDERRKAASSERREQLCSKAAKEVFDSLNPPRNSINKEILLLWITAASVNPSDFRPDAFIYDIEDNMGEHYLSSDDELRSRHVSSMASYAYESFKKYLNTNWRFDVRADDFIPQMPLSEKVTELLGLVNHPQYEQNERLLVRYIENIEVYNRKVSAVERRKGFHSVDSDQPK
ncbi:hypothetical protein [Vibrio agarivorans]|uniref:hypothetical protein n=1 Tax=Vibrio agarivorans TaxID=153622 RepID=UPI0025B587FC|nr:hypothetical protein [Vibrio agarivorans]MDN3661185.1 hypothetical protein [Vibrio agarivorans]